MSDRHYNDNDAEEILRIASREAATGGMTRDRLLETAAELGISPEAVQRAEDQLTKRREADRIQDEEKELRQQFERERKSKFFGDLLTYIAVNAGLVGIWFVTGMHYFWPMWPILGWGIGVAVDFVQTFFNRDEGKFQRWKRRRERKMGTKALDDRAVPVLDEIVSSGEVSKIEAIKELRERLSLDLRDAKDVTDQYEKKNPGVFT